MMRSKHLRRVCVFVILVGATAVVGCGGSSTDASSSTTAVKSAAKLPGKPIVVADISDVTGIPGTTFGSFSVGAAAAVDYINTSLHGVGGRPFKLWTCDSKFDASATATCANGAIAEGAVTEEGLSANLIANGSKALHLKGMVTLNVPDVPQDYVDKMSFPLGGGALSEWPALGYYAATKMKAKKVALVLPDNIAGHAFAPLTTQGLRAGGVATGDINTVYFNTSATDVTPTAVQAMANHPDAIITATIGPIGIKFYQALEQQGYPVSKVLTHGGFINPVTFSQGGAAVNGALMTTEFQSPDDRANADVKIYDDAMAASGKSASIMNEYAQWGFANVMMVYRGAKAAGTSFDARSFTKYMQQNTKVGIPIFMGAVLKDSNASADAPAVRNTSVVVARWNGHQLTPVTDFFSAPASSR